MPDLAAEEGASVLTSYPRTAFEDLTPDLREGDAEADALLDAVGAAGVSYQDVVDVLETEGLEKFEAAWDELLGSVRSGLDAHR